MLNQKTLRKHKKHKNNSERLLLGPPKIRRIRKPKNLGETKKTKKKQKQFWGSLEEKGVQPRVSENCFFGFPKVFLVFLILGGPAKSLWELFFLFFWFSQGFFGFLFFSDFGGSSQESPRIVFLVCLFSHGFWFFLVFSYVFFILYAYLSVFFGFDCGTDAFT